MGNVYPRRRHARLPSAARLALLLPALLLGMTLTAAGRLALTWLQRLYLLRLENKLSIVSSYDFFQHVLRLPVSFFTSQMPEGNVTQLSPV